MSKLLPVLVTVCLVAGSVPTQSLQAQAPATASARTWVDKAAEIEAYLKTAEVVGMEELKIGVTRPRRAKLAPGGPVEAIGEGTLHVVR